MDAVEEGRFRGEPAVIVSAGELSATFLPGLGMTGVSLRWQGREHLALPGGLPALRSGATLGLPLLAPWANRLGSRQYRAAGVDVDLTGLPLGTDANGLPMHGLLVGKPGWRLDRRSAGRGRAGFRASIDVDAPAFPFPHRIEVFVVAREHQLALDTTVIPTGSRPVPVAFGWHPYLRLPGTPRRQWQLRSAVSHPSRPRPARPPNRRCAGRTTGGRTDRPAHLRRPLPPRPRASPRAGGRRGLLDHAPLWTGVSVRPGVGAGRPTVRRVGADGSRHEQPGRRHDTARGTRRGVHRQLHAFGRGTPMRLTASRARPAPMLGARVLEWHHPGGRIAVTAAGPPTQRRSARLDGPGRPETHTSDPGGAA